MRRIQSKLVTVLLASASALALLTVSACQDDPVQPVMETPIKTPAGVIDALTKAYQQRDPELLASLLANDPDHAAEYLFILSDPTPQNDTSWGYTEEVRIHQRMFRPQAPPPGDPPVPMELWLESLTITLTPVTAFTERTDLYTTEPDGYLDHDKWKAMSAKYTTYVLFELAGDTDYRVEGEASFVVLEDLEKQIGEGGKFLLLIWEDLGSGAGILASR